MSTSALSKRSSRSRGGGAYSVDFALPDLPDEHHFKDYSTDLPEFAARSSTHRSCHSPPSRFSHRETPRPTVRNADAQFHGLDGNSYNLPGDSAQYRMPSEKSLPARRDTISGTLDMWPSRPRSIVSSRSKSVAESRGEGTAVNSLYKPKFLQQLETYIEHEKQVLGCEGDPIGSEKRLQIYREVFKFIINDFKTYKGLLSTIKLEYEEHIQRLSAEIGEGSGLKAELAVIRQQHEREIGLFKDSHDLEMVKYQEDNRSLFEFIRSFKDQEKKLQIQVQKLSSELSDEHRRFIEQSDMRKMLLSRVRELEKYKNSKKEEVKKLENEHLKVKIMLRKALGDLATAKEEIATYKSRFTEVVPRYDYDLLEAAAEEAKEQRKLALKNYEAQNESYEKLKKENKELSLYRDQLLREKQRMRRVGTPRPQWDAVAECFSGSASRWVSKSTLEVRETRQSLFIDIVLCVMYSAQVIRWKNISRKTGACLYGIKDVNRSITRKGHYSKYRYVL